MKCAELHRRIFISTVFRNEKIEGFIHSLNFNLQNQKLYANKFEKMQLFVKQLLELIETKTTSTNRGDQVLCSLVCNDSFDSINDDYSTNSTEMEEEKKEIEPPKSKKKKKKEKQRSEMENENEEILIQQEPSKSIPQ